MSGAATARATFELENAIAPLDAETEALFRYDAQLQRAIDQQKPWRANPHFFKNVKISALALVKMTMHCRSGGNLEVMGMMQGKVIGDTFIVLDSFALPVEGTETRVNAGNEANEYMVDVVEMAKSIGRPEHLVGWYHSHPGYGCWMSGIDCSTQMLNQQYQEPWLAVIIDPIRTCAAGKVEIGAFRTYPEGYKPPETGPSEYQTIPLAKIEDFGVHAEQYYSMPVSFFKSSLDAHMLDLLWNKYWVNTLSSSPLAGNRAFVAGQVADLAEKLEAAEAATHGGAASAAGGLGGLAGARAARRGAGGAGSGAEDGPLAKLTRDAAVATLEQTKGLSTQVIKDMLFNLAPAGRGAALADEPMAEA